MFRWLLALSIAGLAPRALAVPAEGATQVEVIQSEADDERPLDDEVRTIDARVGELRERISRTKARLASLQELVTGEDVVAGARTIVRHRNEMSGAFVLEAVTYAVDGSPVFTEANAGGDLEKKPELDVFSGRLAPGHHVVAVRLVYRAAGGGADAPRVKVESTHGFDVQAGKVTRIEAVGHEKSGGKAEERAAVRWRAETEQERAAPPPGAGGGRR